MADASGQSLAYFYVRENDNDADTAGVLTMDEARRMASNFAKLCQCYSVKGTEFPIRSPTACCTVGLLSALGG